MGVGAARLKASFIFRDASTGKEVLHVDHEEYYWLMTDIAGGSKDDAMSRMTHSIAKDLVSDIKHNR